MDWKRLVGQMQTLLKNMPLRRLQRIGHEDVRFLYEPGPDINHITLLPGGEVYLERWAEYVSAHDSDPRQTGT